MRDLREEEAKLMMEVIREELWLSGSVKVRVEKGK